MADISINIKATDNASAQIKNVGDSFNTVGKSVDQAKKSVDQLDKTMKENKSNKSAIDLNNTFTELKSKLELVKKGIEIIGKGITQLANNSQAFKTEIDKWKQGLDVVSKKAGDFLSSYLSQLNEAVGLNKLLNKELQNVAKNQSDIDAKINKNIENERILYDAGVLNINNIKESLANEKRNLEITRQRLKETEEFFKKSDSFTSEDIKKRDELFNKYKLEIKLIQSRQTMIDDYNKKQQEAAEKNKKLTDDIYNNELAKIEAREKANQELIDNELDQWDGFAEELKQNQLKRQFEAFKNTFDQIKKYSEYALSGIQSVFDTIFNGIQGIFSNQLAQMDSDYKNLVESIDEETKRRLEAAGLADQTELEKAQEKYNQLLAMNEEYNSGLTELQEAQLSSLEEKIVNQTDSEIEEAIRKKREKESIGNQEALNEAKKELEKQKILDDSNRKKEKAELEYQKKKADIEEKAFNAKKVSDIANVWMQAAQGVIASITGGIQAFGGIPIVGPGLAAAAGAAMSAVVLANAGIQTGVIASQNYTPAFESGGIVPGNSYSGDRVQAMVNSGEMVLNKNQQTELFNIANGAAGTGDQYINVYIDSEMILQKIITGRKFAEVR